MNHAKEIDAFVHQSFAMYGLDFMDFFNELVDDDWDDDGIPTGGHLKELPLVVEGNIDTELLSQAAKTLGVSTEALLNQDKDAVRCWYEKYPYFELRGKFETAREHSLNFASSPEEMVIDAIFNKSYRPEKHRRYKGNIKGRLVKLLKSYNTVMPGCYHEGCEITELTVQTNNYTHFSQIEDLAESYLFMADRAKELFYRLWDTELPEYEAREYNFLVSVLGMRDVGYSPDRPIYYDLARKFAPVYKQEGYSDYSSYIMYRGADLSAFYTCKEFFDCPELVEKLVQEFPTTKAAFGDIALSVKSFLCSFIWSDEPSCCKVYVPKTKDELHGDEKYIAICEHLSAPASRGGIELSIPEWKQKHDSHVKRVMARCAGGNQHG